MSHGRGGGNTRARRAERNRGGAVWRDERTRTFDVRTVLSLVAGTRAPPTWTTAAGGEAPAGVWPLVGAVELWLERTDGRLVDAVQPHDLENLARVVSDAVRVTVSETSANGGAHLRVTHQVYRPMTGARWSKSFHAAVALNTIEEYTHVLGREDSRVGQILAVFPDVSMRPHWLAAVVSADSRTKADMVARELRAALAVSRSQAPPGEARAASEFVAHARAHQREEWQELQQALAEAEFCGAR